MKPAEACRGRRCTWDASAEAGVLSRCCCLRKLWRRLWGRRSGCCYEAEEVMLLGRGDEVNRMSDRLSRCGYGLWVEQRQRRWLLGRKAWDLCRARCREVCLVRWFGSCLPTVTWLLPPASLSQPTSHQTDAVHPAASSMKTEPRMGPGIGWSRSRDSSSSSLPS
jgi:hypothetical protein